MTSVGHILRVTNMTSVGHISSLRVMNMSSAGHILRVTNMTSVKATYLIFQENYVNYLALLFLLARVDVRAVFPLQN